LANKTARLGEPTALSNIIAVRFWTRKEKSLEITERSVSKKTPSTKTADE
jgi:hypothetical protein